MSKPVPKGFEATDIVYEAGTIYLATEKGERRATGSYYTPDHIVNHMIGATLGPVCERLSRQIEEEIAACRLAIESAPPDEATALTNRLEALEGSFDDRVLELKVLDPAMGSGHFLIRACQYLAEEIATNPFTRDPAAESLPSDESTITYWKRNVAETCLFGVDLNPMAVELAKLALWLETVAADAPLTFLDHHFQCGDSIIGARISWLDSLPGEQGLLEGQFETQIKKALPGILEPLAEIAAIPSDTAEQVKRKEQIFARRFSPAQKRFATTGDLWCASLLANRTASISKDKFERLLDSLSSKKRFDALIEEDWAEKCLTYLDKEGLHCFHWELAFPQVFLAALADSGKPGFDVIIGNPPYDVLAEKESGPHVIPLKKYVVHDATLTPSRVGKNNLYKIFICRALELLSEGGCLSFVVPMPLLGDEQASGVRRALFDQGTFSEIHAFPQKDNPARRVFYDAKLSTALFAYWKGREDEDERAFIAAVHSAQFIEPDSPSLRLGTSEVGLYDTSNLTIVSCAQDDWDIATAIMTCPGMDRLGKYCKSYQGEVNETTQRAFLHEHDGPGRRLVLRGSNVCLYVLREASQGEPLYVDVEAFREGKRPDSKAYHGLLERIGFQRSSPQNNFRRVIAAHMPAGELCFDTVSYVPMSDSTTRLPSEFLLALLNSKLVDWYFRLGSTNSKVNEYQFINLPCPIFRDKPNENDKALASQAQELIVSEPTVLPTVLEPGWSKAPFSPAVRDVLGGLAARIRIIEEKRGTISRQDRAHLCDEVQAHQDAIDLILFRMAGLSAKDIAGIEERLAAML